MDTQLGARQVGGPHAYRLETLAEPNKFATTAVGIKGR